MSSSSMRSTTIVIDASVAAWAVLPLFATVNVVDRFVDWRQRGCRLVAPAHWPAECTSAIRRAVYARAVSEEQGQRALRDLMGLEVDVIAAYESQCRAALEWAARLGQARAYDGFYCALADELQGELWTADQRLARAAREAGAGWVWWIGDTAGEAK